MMSQHLMRRLDCRGFGLVEVMIAMLLFVGAVVALSQLVSYSLRLETVAQRTEIALSLGRAKLEELRVFPATHAERQAGGSLTASVASHFDRPAGTMLERRWVVAAGPAGTQSITLTVVSLHANVRGGNVVLRMLTY